MLCGLPLLQVNFAGSALIFRSFPLLFPSFAAGPSGSGIYSVPVPVPVPVLNFSGVLFITLTIAIYNPDYVGMVKERAKEYVLCPDQLHFEKAQFGDDAGLFGASLLV